MLGLAKPDSVVPFLERPCCCALSGVETKIITDLNRYWGTEEYSECCKSVIDCLDVTQMTYLGESLVPPIFSAYLHTNPHYYCKVENITPGIQF